MNNAIEKCPTNPTVDDKRRWELQSIRTWLTQHKELNTIHRQTGKGGHDGDGSSWVAVAIPDWDVRERIERIDLVLREEAADVR